MTATLLGGCSDPESSSRTLPTASTSTTPGASSPPVLDCGTQTQSQGERLSEKAADCLLGALAADKAARLQHTFLTVEGDPITRTYRSLTSGRVEVTTDNTQDSFGSEGVVSEICIGPREVVTVIDFAVCEDRHTVEARARNAAIGMRPAVPSPCAADWDAVMKQSRLAIARPDLVGLNLADVRELAKGPGPVFRRFRILGKDDDCGAAVNDDYQSKRINVLLVKNKVAWAYNF
ncbi:hypothetical protein [Kineosporia sp. NBRC 101677]|uniref:hypothetical protein n=1 Tax=Kineosporia sp. NBRC 101677 TaxID=3032197 RepID=UPI002552E560|nr:hypothetical protein [Kineosporia sp. NBRC 101677]